MIHFILDTDTLSLFQRKHPAVMASVVAHRNHTAISTITVEEQFGGWFSRLRQARTSVDYAAISGYLASATEMLSQLRVVPMTESAILRFHSLMKQKLNIGSNDFRIAAIALDSSATVVSRNLRDFGRVSGLTVVDWSI